MEGPATDEERAQRFRDVFSDSAALRVWLDASLPKVFGFVFARCGGVEAVAQDIVQETFLEVVRTRSTFEGRSDPLTWVTAIARHKIADHFRRTYREQSHRSELTGPTEAPPDAFGEMDEREAVLRALHALPQDQRIVIAMHYLDGASVREISATLARSESAIESLLARGRERFKSVYREAGEDR